MSSPELVQSALDEEAVVARVALRDDDALFVSPTRTLCYRGQSLLSEESIDEFPHAAECVSLSSGRRKTTIELDYGLDGTRTLTIPNDRADDALHPMLAGVLSAAGVTTPGETVRETFRFSELTLVVTDARLIKHIGAAVWDEEYEEYSFEAVSEFAVEEGQVATQFVLTVSGRRERLKIPNERARAVRESLEDALCSHHEIETISDLGAGRSTDDGSVTESDSPDVVDVEDAQTGFEPASVEGSSGETMALHELGDPETDPSPVACLDALAATVDRQRELLDEQQREIERLRGQLTHDP